MLTKIVVYLLLANSQVPTIPACVNSGTTALAGNWPYIAAVSIQNPPSATARYLDRSVQRVPANCTNSQ